MSADLKSELCPEIAAEVQAHFDHPDSVVHKLGAGVNPITIAIAERVVSAGVDAAINMFGGAATAGVATLKPIIRQVVSAQAIDFLDGLVHQLKDAQSTAG